MGPRLPTLFIPKDRLPGSLLHIRRDEDDLKPRKEGKKKIGRSSSLDEIDSLNRLKDPTINKLGILRRYHWIRARGIDGKWRRGNGPRLEAPAAQSRWCSNRQACFEFRCFGFLAGCSGRTQRSEDFKAPVGCRWSGSVIFQCQFWRRSANT